MVSSGYTNIAPEIADRIRKAWKPPTGKPVREVHTSDRLLHKRCELKHSWQSPLHGWLEPNSEVETTPLFIGNGGHFSLEDYHGHNAFGGPENAWLTYVQAFDAEVLPMEIDEISEMMIKHFNHYTKVWLPARYEYQTAWLDGKPLVEMTNHYPLRRGVIYSTTFDRVVVDPHTDLIYIVDYKFVAKRDTEKLDTDPQITAYSIMGYMMFGDAFGGVLYQQHHKGYPSDVRYLKNGDISTDKSQNVTYAAYRAAVIEKFGTDIPDKYVDTLNAFAENETPDGDKFIVRTLVTRTQEYCLTAWGDILAEYPKMLKVPVHPVPNHTRDCAWDCSFRTACIMRMEGENYDVVLEGNFKRRDQLNAWRDRIDWKRPVLTA